MLPSTGKKELDDLFSLVYEELRRLARNVLRRDRDQQISPTTLVHEAWVKLSRAPSLASVSRVHFHNIAARAMRQVLIDAIRHRRAAMHGGDLVRVTFDFAINTGSVINDREFEALHSALNRLECEHPRQAHVVEARYFGGLSFAEVAQLLGISEETAGRDWRMARAWLSLEVRKELHLDNSSGSKPGNNFNSNGNRGLGHES